MSDFDYIFSDERFGTQVKEARLAAGRNWTQESLVSALSESFFGCGPEITRSTITRIEKGSGGYGILAAIRIADVLDLQLPKTTLDRRIETFATKMITDLDEAKRLCDEQFCTAAFSGSRIGKSPINPLATPSGCLGLLPLFFESSAQIRISIRAHQDFEAFASEDAINRSGVLPVDLVSIFEEMARRITIPSARKSKGIIRIAGFWRHIPSGTSENVRIAGLKNEIDKIKSLNAELGTGSTIPEIDLKHLVVAAFVNFYQLIRRCKAAAGERETPTDLNGYINGFTKLLRLGPKPYLSK